MDAQEVQTGIGNIHQPTPGYRLYDNYNTQVAKWFGVARIISGSLLIILYVATWGLTCGPYNTNILATIGNFIILGGFLVSITSFFLPLSNNELI